MGTKHDGINWLAFARVDKYDPKVVEELTHFLGYEPKSFDFTRLGVTPNRITEVEGNLLTTVGLGNMTNLLIAGGGDGLTAAKTIVGVGDTATAANVADTVLGGNAANAWYQGADSAPTRVTTTVTNDAIQAVTTFATGNANFAWNEWGWAVQSGTGAITGTATLASATAGTETLVNHKIASMGTKASGATWVFTTKVTLS